jgi:hypothetical protein
LLAGLLVALGAAGCVAQTEDVGDGAVNEEGLALESQYIVPGFSRGIYRHRDVLLFGDGSGFGNYANARWGRYGGYAIGGGFGVIPGLGGYGQAGTAGWGGFDHSFGSPSALW